VVIRIFESTKRKIFSYIFIIADYRKGFRLRVFAGAEDPWRFTKVKLRH
jgi:hypothetical protein